LKGKLGTWSTDDRDKEGIALAIRIPLTEETKLSANVIEK